MPSRASCQMAFYVPGAAGLHSEAAKRSDALQMAGLKLSLSISSHPQTHSESTSGQRWQGCSAWADTPRLDPCECGFFTLVSKESNGRKRGRSRERRFRAEWFRKLHKRMLRKDQGIRRRNTCSPKDQAKENADSASWCVLSSCSGSERKGMPASFVKK